jgi:hypothetical protein
LYYKSTGERDIGVSEGDGRARAGVNFFPAMDPMRQFLKILNPKGLVFCISVVSISACPDIYVFLLNKVSVFALPLTLSVEIRMLYVL